MRAEYPFEYSPPNSPLKDLDPPSTEHSTPPERNLASLSGRFPPESLPSDDPPGSLASLLEADPEARALPADIPHTQGAVPSERLSFLTLNAQKAGSNNPSLTDIVYISDLHTPDFLLLTETPLLPKNGALTHILRNGGYKIHYNSINAPSPPGPLPEARLPDHLTHPGGSCWIAYKKNITLAAQVRTVRLPMDYPLATTCAVVKLKNSTHR